MTRDSFVVVSHGVVLVTVKNYCSNRRTWMDVGTRKTSITRGHISMRVLLGLTAIWLATCTASSRRLNLLPRLARGIESPPQPGEVAGPSSSSFSIVAALDTDATRLIAALFGTCFPMEEDDSEVHADLCLPSGAFGSPALLLLAANAALAPMGALAVSDVWVAALPSDADDDRVNTVLSRVLDALAQLPVLPADAKPIRLLVVSGSSEQPDAAGLQRRLQELRASHPGHPSTAHVSIQTAAIGGSGGGQLLSRFSQPERDGYLFSGPARTVAAGLTLRDIPLLIEVLLELLDCDASDASDGLNTREHARGVGTPDGLRSGLRLACDESWVALVGCARAQRRASHVAETRADALGADVAASHVNPIPGEVFAERVAQIFSEGLRAYDQSASVWATTDAFAHQRDELSQSCRESVAALTARQLELLGADALSTFRGELALLLASSTPKGYQRRAKRLVKRSAGRYAKAVRAATSATLFEPAAADGVARAWEHGVTQLQLAMTKEAESHEAEAAELPPREEDVGPPSWWRQLLAQVIGMVLNLGQAYVLQHLPARRRDRLDEQAMPRAPLF